MTISPAKRAIEHSKENGSAPVGKKSKSAGRVQTSLLSHFAKVKESTPGDAENNVIRSSPVKESQIKPTGAILATAGKKITTAGNSPTKVQGVEPPTASDSSRSSSPAVQVSFSPEERQLLELEIQFLPDSWYSHLAMELKKPYFLRLKEFLKSEKSHKVKIFPPNDLVYSWARLCPLDRVKVVLIGQDPYHNDRQAMGLCFSVPRGIVLPPSLINIYKELATDIPGFKAPQHGDLTFWAQQGVLLLNTSLTVKAHEPASHSGKGWEQFTDAVIRAVNQYRKNVVFILWGNHAQKKTPMIDKQRHFVLTGVHPSPLSASRGFFGCRHFSKTNEYLQKNGIEPIDWQLPL